MPDTRQAPITIPAGYERRGWGEPIGQLSCLTCGASVYDSAAEQHSTWHQRMYDRLGFTL